MRQVALPLRLEPATWVAAALEELKMRPTVVTLGVVSTLEVGRHYL